MSEELTYEQIKEKYDGQWVLAQETEEDQCMRFLRGIVLAHSPDRQEIYRKLGELKPTHSTILRFVKEPENMAYVL